MERGIGKISETDNNWSYIGFHFMIFRMASTILLLLVWKKKTIIIPLRDFYVFFYDINNYEKKIYKLNITYWPADSRSIPRYSPPHLATRWTWPEGQGLPWLGVRYLKCFLCRRPDVYCSSSPKGLYGYLFKKVVENYLFIK